MKDFSVVLPSFKCSELLYNAIESFEKFKPDSITVNYIVVENSNENDYVEELRSKFPTAKWIDNKNAPKHGSDANASALELGTKNCETDLIFFCHTDVAVLHENFYECIFKKYEEGFPLIGFRIDKHPKRIKAVHQSGFLTTKEIASKSELFGNYKHWSTCGENSMDCGDGVTKYCRENGLKYFTFNNTFNGYDINKVKNLKLKFNYPKVNAKKPVFDFAVDDNDILVYSHLGRGSSKLERKKVWFNFCDLYLK